MAFQRATKKQARLRMALIGPSGSGKTFTALQLARYLGEKVALIDTERGSASKYAGPDGFVFDTCELDSFHPQKYINTIKEAEEAGYDVLIIDSLSHAWMGKDGALELVDKAAIQSQSGNTFAAWRKVTPLHNSLVDAMLQSRCHIIVTMRAKTEYVLETNDKGKQVPRKVGMAPVQRDGLEYEFDVIADMDLDNNLIVSKSRCKVLTGAVIPKPGKEIADTLRAWLTDGAEVPQPQQPPRSSEPADQKPATRAAPAAGPRHNQNTTNQPPASRAPQDSQGSEAPAQGNGNGGSGDGPTWNEFWKVIRGELKLSNADAAKKLGRTDFKGLDAAGRKAVIDELRAMAGEGKVA